MITADYHIVPSGADAIDPARCELVLAVNHRFFQYIVLEEKNKVVALKFYLLSPEAGKSRDALEEILASDELLNKGISVTAVVYIMPESQLIPPDHYDPALSNELLSLVHGDLHKGQLLEDKMEGDALHNVYRVPGAVYTLLQEKLSPARASHFYSLWLEQVRSGQYSGNSVCAWFYPGELLVMLIKEGALQLVQQIAYETAEDVSYHLLNIYRQFDLLPAEQPLRIGGMIETDSAMYEELLKYFMSVEIEEQPADLELAAGFSDFPGHFFAPLLKIAPCVL